MTRYWIGRGRGTRVWSGCLPSGVLLTLLTATSQGQAQRPLHQLEIRSQSAQVAVPATLEATGVPPQQTTPKAKAESKPFSLVSWLQDLRAAVFGGVNEAEAQTRITPKRTPPPKSQPQEQVPFKIDGVEGSIGWEKTDE